MAEHFVVRNYIGDDGPTIKGNGFDGTRVGEDREDAEALVKWINERLTRIAELESAIREAAWIICDHGTCEAVEWSMRRGNWEDKYADKASQLMPV